MRGPEFFEKQEIDSYLESINAVVFKPTTGGFGASGCPDRLACIYRSLDGVGVFWGIEVKREGKQPTRLQWNRIQAIQDGGGQATWGTAKKVINEIEVWRGMRRPE